MHFRQSQLFLQVCFVACLFFRRVIVFLGAIVATQVMDDGIESLHQNFWLATNER